MEETFTKQEVNEKVKTLQQELSTWRQRQTSILKEEYKNKLKKELKELVDTNQIAIFRTGKEPVDNTDTLYVGYLSQNFQIAERLYFSGLEINYEDVWIEGTDDDFETEFKSYKQVWKDLSEQEVDSIELCSKTDSTYCDFKDYLNSFNTYLK